MNTWKVDKIVEYYPNIVDSGEDFQNLKIKYFKRVTEYPENYQLWFYYIKKKNISALNQMLLESAVHINLPNPNNGETIVHYSIRKKSLKLLDFCIKNKADFHIRSINEDETPFFEICYPYVGINVFKKVINVLDEKGFQKVVKDQNIFDYETILDRLIRNDKNLKKIIWIEKRFPISWSKIKQDKNYYSYLISRSEEANAKEVTFFLKGLQKIKNDLERELININFANKVTKI